MRWLQTADGSFVAMVLHCDSRCHFRGQVETRHRQPHITRGRSAPQEPVQVITGLRRHGLPKLATPRSTIQGSSLDGGQKGISSPNYQQSLRGKTNAIDPSVRAVNGYSKGYGASTPWLSVKRCLPAKITREYRTGYQFGTMHVEGERVYDDRSRRMRNRAQPADGEAGGPSTW